MTPIQLAAAITAVANEGKMMAPHILKSMVSNGRQYNTTPQVIANPIKAETARTLTEMLATSLEEESSDALVDGYRLAGKTGTAEIRPNMVIQWVSLMLRSWDGDRLMIRNSWSMSGWKNQRHPSGDRSSRRQFFGKL